MKIFEFRPNFPLFFCSKISLKYDHMGSITKRLDETNIVVCMKNVLKVFRAKKIGPKNFELFFSQKYQYGYLNESSRPAENGV